MNTTSNGIVIKITSPLRKSIPKSAGVTRRIRKFQKNKPAHFA